MGSRLSATMLTALVAVLAPRTTLAQIDAGDLDKLLTPGVTVTGHGFSAEFRTITLRPAFIRVWVSEQPAGPDFAFPGETLSPVPLPPPARTETITNVGPLKYNKTYFYVVRATSEGGVIRHVRGDFNSGYPPAEVAGWDMGGTHAVLHLKLPPWSLKPKQTYLVAAAVGEEPPGLVVEPNPNKKPTCEKACIFAKSITIHPYGINVYFAGLKAGTEYHYELTYRLDKVVEQRTKGEVTTLQRYVDVSFDRVTVYKDGDSGALAGDGELMFTFWADGTPVAYHHVVIGDGQKFYPGIKTTVKNAGDVVTLEVGAVDNDGDCEMGTRDVSLSNGAACHSDWGAGLEKQPVGPKPDGREAYERPFNFGTVDHGVDFRVQGTLRVRYVP